LGPNLLVMSETSAVTGGTETGGGSTGGTGTGGGSTRSAAGSAASGSGGSAGSGPGVPVVTTLDCSALPAALSLEAQE